jgi:hypothetical protein
VTYFKLFRRYIRGLAMALVLALVGAGLVVRYVWPSEPRAGEPPSPAAVSRLGQKTVPVLQDATDVEVYSIDGHAQRHGTGEGVESYPILHRAPDQGAEFTGRLVATLLRVYDRPGPVAACFFPGVAFRIRDAKGEVDVLVCFECENVRVVGAKQMLIGFRPMRRWLVKLAQEALPDDPDIQALK